MEKAQTEMKVNADTTLCMLLVSTWYLPHRLHHPFHARQHILYSFPCEAAADIYEANAMVFLHVPHQNESKCIDSRKLLHKRMLVNLFKHTFLGLLAKIKCSICSYQFNI
ncbi:hypothetical protein H5410_043006 [Solanum commersonii]|uniref:Uncharacterized protein n=1 Tax=Solanum commersonii TaxID=4109 RepID=A0A9J5XZC4_SOLCO|nr:hypothetical protein H5410_043006 [Solanum commersonii]